MADTIDIFAILSGRAASAPDAPALMFEHDVTSFGAFVEQVDRMIGLICREGLAPGMTVGVSVGDQALHLAAAFALLSLGAPHVCLPAHEPDAALRVIAGRLGIAMVLRDRPTPWAEGIATVDISFDAVKGAPSGAASARRVVPGDVSAYVKTSGSTDVPKLFGVSYARALEAGASYAAEPLERRVMRTSSTDFDSSRGYRIHALLAGLPAVFAPRDLRRIGAVCAQFDVTQIHIGTYRLASLLADGGALDPLPPVTTIFTGGSRVPASMRAAVVDRLTEKLFVSYATSEVGRISTARPEEHAAHPEGVGFPEPDVAVEILDEDGAPAAPGEIGTIRVRKAFAPRAYVGRADAAQFRDGWFHPNDRMSRSNGGPLIYHGRADDVMLLNGIKVSGSAIEDALSGLPQVREAVAFPLASRLHGEIPAAAVVLHDSAERRDGADILAECRRLLGVRAPRRILVVEKIPRTPTGKPIKRALAEL
ncbi:fatty acid--CoA ligase family protein [Methylopila sp. M107]|uniref:class I adenylate-forming enzyme family protein n=1 Tax=Methylopila sp. M107 TaxID=1101190 RepID=UPI00037EDA18|nr:fatty acid--CoA ligase family protein [Methylopila sp. M107]